MNLSWLQEHGVDKLALASAVELAPAVLAAHTDRDAADSCYKAFMKYRKPFGEELPS